MGRSSHPVHSFRADPGLCRWGFCRNGMNREVGLFSKGLTITVMNDHFEQQLVADLQVGDRELNSLWIDEH